MNYLCFQQESAEEPENPKATGKLSFSPTNFWQTCLGYSYFGKSLCTTGKK